MDKDRLRSLVQRIESIESERAELASDAKDILAEAKGPGRSGPWSKRTALQATIEEYVSAMGDYGTTSLGAAAIARAGR